ncbi:MAG: hypothetical protein IT307_04005 [Chloroflexi bacterium]|nr:hypothetical protein [Chloroflexota bacterium]
MGAGDGLTGCDASTLAANDDDSTSAVNLGFTINFFHPNDGTRYSQVYVNNNGNVTFDGSLSAYRPFDLTSTTHPIIAAFFGDVDTRGTGSGVVTYGAGSFNGRPSFCVNWFDVGYYALHTDKTNRFQLVLQERSDTGNGNFDIYLNYDRVVWDSTDTSTSAGVGYSGGTGTADTFFQLSGSLTSGAFLDGNATSGLVHRRTNSSVDGRLYFQVRSGTAPIGKTISGRVTGTVGNSTIALAGAPVGVCPSQGGVILPGQPCATTSTNGSGDYNIPGLASREYVLIGKPPASQNALVETTVVVNMPTRDITQDLLLQPVIPKPSNISIVSTPPGTINGAPRLLWGQTTPIAVATGFTGATHGTFTVRHNGNVISTGPLVETPAGSGVYAGVIPDLSPAHGPMQISVDPCQGPDADLLDICDPSGQTTTGWVDPSGVVRTVGGAPVNGATVTLYRSDSSAGPFTAVADGSAVMSPSNRHNPDTTGDDGRFGWDVIPGYYKVRAAKTGCVSPTNPNQAYEETAIMTIPPPVTDLDIRLSCPAGSDGSAPTTSATVSPAPSGNGYSNGIVTVDLAAVDNSGGSGVKQITYSASGATTIASTTVNFRAVSVVIGVEGQTTVSFFAKDNAGNTESQKTVAVKLDKGAPTITITSPTATGYFVNQALLATYSCQDGAGVASCAGGVANGGALTTASVGARTFTVNASDNLGHNGSKTVNYAVTYKICQQYDPNLPVRAGSSKVIKLQLCDANNVALAGPALTSVAVVKVAKPTSETRRPRAGKSVGAAAATIKFKYNKKLQSYTASVPTKKLAPGNYELQFTAVGDPIVHAAPFKVVAKKSKALVDTSGSPEP